METYFILCNYTQQGIENIKESPQRIEVAKKATEAAGGKWGGWWLTMGEYDFIVMAEAPNAQTVATLILAIGAQGNVRTKTMRAFTQDEFVAMAANMP